MLLESVEHIAPCAFMDCSRLTDIAVSEYTRPEGLAFSGTPWLNAMGDFPIVNDRLMKYNGCDDKVTIPDGVKRIDAGAFLESNISHVSIPASVQEIEDEAFVWCHSLRSVVIPKSVKKIGDYAFDDCTELIRA